MDANRDHRAACSTMLPGKLIYDLFVFCIMQPWDHRSADLINPPLRNTTDEMKDWAEKYQAACIRHTDVQPISHAPFM